MNRNNPQAQSGQDSDEQFANRSNAENAHAHESHDDSAYESAVDASMVEPSAPSPKRQPTSDERVLEAERQVLRAHAELENFRKRMQRDSEQQVKYANLPLIRDLLDVVDNLNRGLDAARDETGSAALRSGVEMVGHQLTNTLAKYGCKPIEAVGSEFDPNIHEAITQMPSHEYAAGFVAQEVGVGYLLHDRVVRPSSVIVSTGPAT